MRLIDADKLLNENCGYVLWGEYKSCAECYEDHKHKCYHEIDAQDIMDAPTIEADPIKHGRWETPKGYPNVLLCSECNTPYEKKEFVATPNYCPNCGVRMDEVEE